MVGVKTDNLEARYLMAKIRQRNTVAFPLSGNKSKVGEE